jgi:hypothetical protein
MAKARLKVARGGAELGSLSEQQVNSGADGCDRLTLGANAPGEQGGAILITPLHCSRLRRA